MPERMPYNNIATAINTWAAERCTSARIADGSIYVVKEDLSNIVDVGTAIYNAGWVDSFVKSMVLQIGRWIFVNRVHRRWTPDITREGSEFGHVLAKTRTKRFAAKQNPTMHMNAGDTPNQFQFNPPTVKNKYFVQKVDWQLECSFAERQVQGAFRSAEEMARFFGMIQDQLQKDMDQQIDDLTMRGINGFIAEKIYRGSGVIDVLTPFNTENGTSLTLDSMTQSESWNRYCAYTILKTKKRMLPATNVYNCQTEAGYETSTPPEYMRFVLHSDIAEAINVYLNAVTFHNDFSDIGSYDSIPMWQTPGTDFQRGATTRIDIDLPSNVDREEADAVTINRIGIIGVMFDVDAIVINNQNERVTSAYNAQGEFYNNFYKIDTMIYIDLDENGAVFVAGEGTVPSITLNKTTASVAAGSTTSITATTVPAGATVTWSSDDEDVATVAAGTVTGVAAGEADIMATITVNEVPYSAHCKVTVTAAAKAKSSKAAADAEAE